ncbi:hypothetical protein Aspvir_003663 [Aspergillus viridinutans]|uniref:Uncharacterized protein n=1 Tax=Aspergillus viridinutans TaxID=75553 RepID=A0A9P3BNL2_ASPVI|nr:uncharacterized protein Aspvir_003663 [Aspergillus viridinutans]GIJ99662.1 hypothetical protein Aspvir_003663 [Aspergillus viridinutans]
MAHQVQGTAFITGGASGIGEATAHVLAKNGISALALLDVNPVLLEETKKQLLAEYAQLRVAAFQVDVRDEAAVEDAVRKTAEEFGQIDIGVNAAGISGKAGPSHDTDLSDWQRVIDINQTGLWICQRALIRQMLKQESRGARDGRGTIVNIASMYGVRAPSGDIAIAPYVAAKHAVVGNDQDDLWIRLIRRSIESGALDSQVAMIPLGRRAVADEIANAILFLASPMSSYMCGEAMVVDGGLTALSLHRQLS